MHLLHTEDSLLWQATSNKPYCLLLSYWPHLMHILLHVAQAHLSVCIPVSHCLALCGIINWSSVWIKRAYFFTQLWDFKCKIRKVNSHIWHRSHLFYVIPSWQKCCYNDPRSPLYILSCFQFEHKSFLLRDRLWLLSHVCNTASRRSAPAYTMIWRMCLTSGPNCELLLIIPQLQLPSPVNDMLEPLPCPEWVAMMSYK